MQSPLEVRVTKQNASQQTAAAAAVAHEHKDLCDKKSRPGGHGFLTLRGLLTQKSP